MYFQSRLICYFFLGNQPFYPQYDFQDEFDDVDMQNVDAFKDPSEFLVNPYFAVTLYFDYVKNIYIALNVEMYPRSDLFPYY